MAERDNERTPGTVDPTGATIGSAGATLGPDRPLGGSPVTPSRGLRGLTTFVIGDLVGGRYKIVRHLGAGGMGEVHEAEDLLLREQVALKTVRPDVASDERVISRFKREIQLARRVTHPNVCRIFDVGLHRQPGACDVAFLTMELLEGQTLAQRLARGGRMTPAEAAPLCAQMAAALDAAHDAGVIHRDFKSANVLLTPGERGTTRAVVTDFGLARGVCAPADPSVTGDGGVVGSPSYMAPEQVEGKELTGATDVYALGVVMYEMLTGRLPFVAETPMATAVLRLREDPAPPSAHATDLPPIWDEIVLACLARDPALRPRSARAALEALFVACRRARRPRPWRVALAAALAASAAVAYLALWPKPPPSVEAPEESIATIVARADAESTRRSVAVLGFRNLTGRASDGWIAGAVAEMLATELSASDDIRVIPGESVERARRELALGDDVSYAPDTLARLRVVLGADYVLTGTYILVSENGRFRLDLRLVDTRTGDDVPVPSQTGTEDDLVEVVGATGKALRSRLEVDQLSATELAFVRATFPKPDVARLYAEGLAQMRVAACSAARGPLEQAVAADPDFALARSALAEALACLGHEHRALEEARLAVEHAASLPEQVRLATEGRLHLVARQPDKALDVYQKLFDRFPDNFDYGLQLAHLQLRFMHEKELVETLRALRRLPAPIGDSPRIDLIEAMLDVLSGKPDQGLARAEAAHARADAEGMRLVAADALIVETHIHAEAERHERALATIDEARAIFEAAGDLDGIATALSIEAYVRQGAGDVQGVKRAEEQVLGISQSLDNDKHELLRFKRLLGIRLAGLGDLRGALSAIADALEIARGRGDPDATAAVASYGAWLYLESGEMTTAEELASDALVDGVSAVQRAALLQVLATIEAIGDDFASAHEHIDQALRASKGSSRVGVLASRASILVLEGRHGEAEKIARAALDDAGALRPLVRFALAGALLGQHRYPEALQTMAELDGSPFFKQFPQAVGLAVMRAQARLGAGGEGAAGARAELDAAIARAAGGSFRYSELDARLRLGGVLLETGDRRGHEVLAEVARDAERLGYKLLARRARVKAG